MKIAVIGLPALYSRGFKSLIGESDPEHEVDIYPIEERGWQDADCYVVSAAALATLARFLMPKLDSVLLVSNSVPSGHTLMPMLSPLASEKEIAAVIRRLFAGLADKDKISVSHRPLTPRETDVLRYTAMGLTSRQIAARLSISLNTVLTHRKNIAEKTGLHTVSAITHFAMLHGLMH